ncbi:MAG: hypothetical protein U5S82_00295 [Gammaproteobacteria bacterium]|nr:hypothetical protein [Gammaproteobacteria bacterium]
MNSVDSMRLDDFREEFESGKPAALLLAIEYCAAWCLVMPEWVHAAYHDAMEKWSFGEAMDLEDAFSRPSKRRDRNHTLKHELRSIIFVRATQLKGESDRPSGRDFFEELADRINDEWANYFHDEHGTDLKLTAGKAEREYRLQMHAFFPEDYEHPDAYKKRNSRK